MHVLESDLLVLEVAVRELLETEYESGIKVRFSVPNSYDNYRP